MKAYDITLPLWDETAAAIMAFPDLVVEKVKAYMDVNTAFDGPDLGRTHLLVVIPISSHFPLVLSYFLDCLLLTRV